MTNYKVIRQRETKILLHTTTELEGYHFSPRKKAKSSLLQTNEIVIINPSLIEKILAKTFAMNIQKIKKIIAYILLHSEEDTSATGIVIALTEITKVRHILLTKYAKYLKKEQEIAYLKELHTLEVQLKEKAYFMQRAMQEKEKSFYAMEEQEKKEGKGR